MRRPFTVVLVLLAVLAGAAACGTESAPGTESYNVYRELEDARNKAELDLRQAIADINNGAVEKDREAVLAAAQHGLDAVHAIQTALDAEFEAAHEMAAISALTRDAKDLEDGLTDTRKSLDIFVRMLQVALEDPFLEQKANVAKVSSLSKQGTDLAVDGEVAVRKADRKLAVALGLEPRIDQLLDNPLAPTTTG